MAGQGLGPLMNKKPDILIAPPSRALARMPRRDSPTYDPYRCCTEQTPLAWGNFGSCLYKLPPETCSKQYGQGYVISNLVLWLMRWVQGLDVACSPHLQVQAVLVWTECSATVLTAACSVLAGETQDPDQGLNQGRQKLQGGGQSTLQSSRPPRGVVMPMVRLAVHPMTCLRPNGR